MVRTQIKWVIYAALVAAVAWLVIPLTTDETLWSLASLAAVGLIPAAITIAITRYRLFEIDRLISRTVSYAIVIGLLAAVYVTGVFLITELFSGQNDIAVAASTLAVAALFSPIRKRVQSVVDRRFNRTRYDGEQIVAEFTSRLRDNVDLETLTGEWVSVINDTVQPESVSVWVKEQSD